MPTIQHLEWLTRNSLRSFPLREDVPLVSDRGLTIPNDIIVDAFITTIGSTTSVALHCLCITARLVTVILADASTGATIGSATVLATEGHQYLQVPVQSPSGGVIGSITFGPGILSLIDLNLYFGTNTFP